LNPGTNAGILRGVYPKRSQRAQNDTTDRSRVRCRCGWRRPASLRSAAFANGEEPRTSKPEVCGTSLVPRLMLQESIVECCGQRSDYKRYSLPFQGVEGILPVGPRLKIEAKNNGRQEHNQRTAQSSCQGQRQEGHPEGPLSQSDQRQSHQQPSNRENQRAPDEPKGNCARPFNDDAEDRSRNKPCDSKRFE
jgi:hypothetical protein